MPDDERPGGARRNDGDFGPAADEAFFRVVSPATEQVVAHVPRATASDVDRAVDAARGAFDHGPWPRMPLRERVAVLRRLSAALHCDVDDIAELVTRQNGTPYEFSRMAQAYAPLMVLDYYLDLAETFPFEEIRPGMLGPTHVRGVPVGVVAAITAWNMPLYQALCKLAPALLAGCTAVLKPSPQTPLDALLLARAAAEAGLPEGVLRVVVADSQVSAYLAGHPGLDKVSFTGSVQAGRQVMAACSSHLTRVSLELGGKSAAVILDDADLDAVVDQVAALAYMNSGQSCVAQTRVLVPRAQYADVAERLVHAVSRMAVGDPMDPATRIGPLVSADRRARVEEYLALGAAEGARLAVGGERPADLPRGWYLRPALFTEVTNDMRIAQEEIFGPVACLIGYDDEDDAVRIADASPYGLAGTVWTADVERGLRVARRIRAGSYSVNMFNMEMGAPFGGFKHSGIGRELGPEGLREYVEYQTIHTPALAEPATGP
ncbi:aldehyde dehydrogenase [Streptomyces sp. ODS05-4]|uniref:aldehyde dehydrogenase n=1 Tax=Streptomyces sp. ODS05-4 TaxID=2944939 RepID=UPI00210937F8|nr:aldehyde dehydrogenase [Streptomyces sp. ODS05-4]